MRNPAETRNGGEGLPDGPVAVPVRRIADEWIASDRPLIEVDADAHPSRPPRILQGPKSESRADLGFRAAMRMLRRQLAGRSSTPATCAPAAVASVWTPTV